MLICTVHSDVLIIFLLKTCWHYPGDTRNVNAAFPVKFGPMGTMRVSVCSPWLAGHLWRCTAVRRALAASQATTGSSGSLNSHYNNLHGRLILSFTFSFGQFTCGPSSPFPQFLSPSASQSKSGSGLMISSQQMKSSGHD